MPSPSRVMFWGQKVESKLIGESRELSCDPQFSSRSQLNQKHLKKLISDDPRGMLGENMDRFGEQLKLIIKLVNSRMPLSYQVHPDEGYPKLNENESAKTESWLVLDVEPGSGIYLGFNKKFTKEQILDAINRGNGELKITSNFFQSRRGSISKFHQGLPMLLAKV